ncbi:MAG TPA: hypothetical protein VK753_01440 [Xanthomonadaceae bacterium]|nr:hypothetical protein [Xanthomonadaceae bacterium]
MTLLRRQRKSKGPQQRDVGAATEVEDAEDGAHGGCSLSAMGGRTKFDGPEKQKTRAFGAGFGDEREWNFYALIAGLLEVGVVVPIVVRKRARACADAIGDEVGQGRMQDMGRS